MWQSNELFGELFSEPNDIQQVLYDEFVDAPNEISATPDMNGQFNYSLEQCPKNDEPETGAPTHAVSALDVPSPENISLPNPIQSINSHGTSVHALPSGVSYQVITSPFPICENMLYTGWLILDH